MAAAPVELFSNCDICQWQAALLCYEEIVALKAAERLKKNAKSVSKGGETLVELDTWYELTIFKCMFCELKVHTFLQVPGNSPRVDIIT